MKKIHIVNGIENTQYEWHIGKLCIIMYTKCKHREKLVQVVRDRFFGTGVTVFIFKK